MPHQKHKRNWKLFNTHRKAKQQQMASSTSKEKIKGRINERKELGSSLENFSGNISREYLKKRSA